MVESNNRGKGMRRTCMFCSSVGARVDEFDMMGVYVSVCFGEGGSPVRGVRERKRDAGEQDLERDVTAK